uniref:Ovule protein n=1 Tax=Rhabditophanes sp. KR3021 TaxID=114890 RepID=A0AC35U9U3_9BILA
MTNISGQTEEHSKRVSFGGEEHVKMIVYEETPLEETTYIKTSFTSSDAPPSKVTVTTQNSELPRPISPPTQIEEPTHLLHSPPLPSLSQKMNSEVENPFRPELTLYHEVDPIVEQYKTKPFPASPTISPCVSPTKQHRNSEEVALLTKTLEHESHQKSDVYDPHRGSTSVIHAENNSSKYVDESGDIVDLPNKVELVHLDKKKKCCCNLQ